MVALCCAIANKYDNSLAVCINILFPKIKHWRDLDFGGLPKTKKKIKRKKERSEFGFVYIGTYLLLIH